MKKGILVIVFLILCGAAVSRAEKLSLPQYDNLTIIPHTGEMQYTVTLGKLTDLDFDWTFSLNYVSDGFRPLCYSNVAGENWMLNASGSITREIIGLADDVMINSSWEHPNDRIGLLYILRDSLCEPVSKEYVYDLSSNNSDHCWFPAFFTLESSDWQSDIYTFSFNGYTGKFVIGFDDQAHIISGDYVDIDISGMSIQYKNGLSSYYNNHTPLDFQPIVSTIKITTLDGYTYVFGGNLNSLGYTTTFNCLKKDMYLEPDIVTWNLTKVIAPNKRTMFFHYKEDVVSDSISRYYHNLVHFANDAGTIIESYNVSVMNIKDSLSNIDFPLSIRTLHSAIDKRARLDSITTSDNSYKAIFTYQPLDNIVYESDYVNGEYSNKYAKFRAIKKDFLQRVQFFSDSALLADWNLEYQQIDLSSTKRQYLQSVVHHAGIAYNFEYNLTNTEQLNNISHVDSVDIGGYRISHPTFGTLKNIHDPMGCITTFEYARCRYDSIRIYDASLTSSTLYLRWRHDINSIVLNRITKYDNIGNVVSKRRYEYGDFYNALVPLSERSSKFNNINDSLTHIVPGVGASSGTLNVDFAIMKGIKSYDVCPYIALTGTNKATVTYSKVREFVEEINSERDSYQTIFYYDNTNDITSVKNLNSTEVSAFFGTYSLFSLAERRAKLKCQEEYDNQRRLRRTTRNSYYPIILDSMMLSNINIPNAQIAEWYSGRKNHFVYKFYANPSYLIRQEIIEHENNGEYHIETNYQLDSKQRLTQQIISQGTMKSFTRYSYPDYLQIDTTNVNEFAKGYLQLVKDNRINTPVEEIRGIIQDSTFYVTQGNIILYKNQGKYDIYDTIPIIESIPRNSLYPGTNDWYPIYSVPYSCYKLTTNIKIPLNMYESLSCTNSDLYFDNRYEEVETYHYNSLLRVREILPRTGLATSFEWDEKNLHILSQTTGAMTTRFSYIPHVGISSKTDPRGITTYYSYDDLGNLREIYQIIDGKKIVLQARHFHYSTQTTL